MSAAVLDALRRTKTKRQADITQKPASSGSRIATCVSPKAVNAALVIV